MVVCSGGEGLIRAVCSHLDDTQHHGQKQKQVEGTKETRTTRNGVKRNTLDEKSEIYTLMVGWSTIVDRTKCDDRRPSEVKPR